MLTRRRFIQSGLAASTAPGLGALASNSGEAPEYRALVCIYLAGGNDSFNMLVPAQREQYALYRRARGNLAIDPEDLLPLSGTDDRGEQFALHSSLRGLHRLYEEGAAAGIANVGALPSMKSMLGSPPEGVSSHALAMHQWQTCGAESNTLPGWGSRVASTLPSRFAEPRIPTNLSLSGGSIFQQGPLPGAYGLVNDPATLTSSRRERGVVSIDFDHLNERLAATLAEEISGGVACAEPASRAALNIADEFAAATSALGRKAKPLDDQFSGDPFSQKLAQVAKIIAARESLQADRQIFYVCMNGWDHHHHLLRNHATMLARLSDGLSSFAQALKSIDAFDDVTTFTTSEFGRSLISNGTGSDHGWSGHQLVMGGSVRGGRIFGEYPLLPSEEIPRTDGGIFRPTALYDDYFAMLSRWLGVPEANLTQVFPGLRKLGTQRELRQLPRFLS